MQRYIAGNFFAPSKSVLITRLASYRTPLQTNCQQYTFAKFVNCLQLHLKIISTLSLCMLKCFHTSDRCGDDYLHPLIFQLHFMLIWSLTCEKRVSVYLRTYVYEEFVCLMSLFLYQICACLCISHYSDKCLHATLYTP